MVSLSAENLGVILWRRPVFLAAKIYKYLLESETEKKMKKKEVFEAADVGGGGVGWWYTNIHMYVYSK